MYFLLDNQRRKARGGGLYLEFQPGPWKGKHWQEDSVYLPAPLFDDLGLYDLFAQAIEDFAYYGVTLVTAEQFQALMALARDHHTQCASLILEELAPWVGPWLDRYGCCSILGI